MSDDDITTNDDREELLRAYVDGELDAEQRAVVESSPDLAAEAHDVAAIRAALGDVAAVDPERRETHIAAALAEFDSMRATSGPAATSDVDTGRSPTADVTAPPPPPSNVTSLRPRRWNWSHSLAAAAAAVLVVVGGVLWLRDDADAPTAGDEPNVLEAPTTVLSRADDNERTDDGDLLEDAADAPGDAGGNAESDSDGAQPEDAEMAEPMPVQPPAAAPTAIDSSADLPLLESADEFADFAAEIDDPPGADDVAERCAAGEEIAPDARLVVDDDEIVVVVVEPTDGDRGDRVAFDVEECQLVDFDPPSA